MKIVLIVQIVATKKEPPTTKGQLCPLVGRWLLSLRWGKVNYSLEKIQQKRKTMPYTYAIVRKSIAK